MLRDLRLVLTTGIVVIAILFAGNASSLPEPAIAADGESGNFTQTELPLKGNPKLDSALNRLASEYTAISPAPLMAKSAPQSSDTTIRVIIEAAPGQMAGIASAVGDLGSIEASYGDLVQMVVPVSQLTALADRPEIRFVRPPNKPLPTETSEGVSVINADDWLAASYNGTDVKIGILDVGFSGYTTRQGEGELPAVTPWWAPSIGGSGTSVHGTGVAEIVYDIAPASNYYFANFATVVEYGNAVSWLISQGVDVISCSVGWPTGGPGDGTGTICQIVDTAKAAGILWAQAVGNQAERHWQGDFANADADAYHDFAPGDEGNTISVISGYTITAALKWDDTWGASANDYDLLLYDSNSNLVAYSLNVQDGDDDPYESLSYTANYTGNYFIAIGKLGTPAVVNFHLYSYYHDLQYQTASSSFLVPADSFGAMAVGAVDYSTPTALESFSSHGPTDDGRTKPDIVAPDGVSTVSYGATAFSGTSASAPHAAGAAALVKERFSSYTPAQIQSFLEGRAVDLGDTGKDNLYGSGRLHLGDSANNYVLTMAVSGSGSVIPATGTHSYSEGTVASVNATADSGWQFTEWIGDVANPSSASTNVTMTSDKTVTANFNETTANLTIAIDGSGNVTPSVGSHSYPLSSKVEITATPAANWEFVNWIGDVDDANSATTNVTVDTDRTVIANFNRLNSVLQMKASGSDNVTPAVGNHAYPLGTIVDITATDTTNWAFASWTGDVSDNTSASTNVTMNWDKTVTANFNRVAGTLTMAVSGSGSTTPSTGNHTYAAGSAVDILATPDGGWMFVNWTGDVSTVADVNSASTNVTMDSDYSIIANFSQATLTMAVSGSGSTTPVAGSHTYAVGATVNITATPVSGWNFVNWTGDVGTVADVNSDNTTVTVDNDYSITANFSEIVPGLVSHWSFDEGSGSTVADSENANDGTVVGASWTTRVLDNALSFDGSNDYVSVPHDSSLAFNGEGSIELWVKPNVMGGKLIWKRVYVGSNGWTLYTSSNNEIIGYVNDNAAHVSAALTSGQWKHVAMVYESGVIKLYIGGVLSDSETVPGGFQSTTVALYIGRDEIGNYFDGDIDEV
ncbi:S8 family serine peptidase, partial [Chloroflexota bacterium]